MSLAEWAYGYNGLGSEPIRSFIASQHVSDLSRGLFLSRKQFETSGKLNYGSVQEED